MERSELQLLLLGAILLFIYIDMRFARLEARLRREGFARIPDYDVAMRTPQRQNGLRPMQAPEEDSYVNQMRDAFQQYVPTRAEQLAVMTPQSEQGGAWSTDFAKPIWDPQQTKAGPTGFDMSQVQPWGANNDLYSQAPIGL